MTDDMLMGSDDQVMHPKIPETSILVFSLLERRVVSSILPLPVSFAYSISAKRRLSVAKLMWSMALTVYAAVKCVFFFRRLSPIAQTWSQKKWFPTVEPYV